MGSALFEPYVPEKVSFAIRYHQALGYYPDPSVGYEYPDLTANCSAPISAAPIYRSDLPDGAQASLVHGRPARNGERLYAFDPNAAVTIEPSPTYRTPFQGAQRGSGKRRQSGGPHVAHNYSARPATVNAIQKVPDAIRSAELLNSFCGTGFSL